MSEKIVLDGKLIGEYRRLWDSMVIDPGQRPIIAAAASRILSNKTRYQVVEARTGVPWWWIGLTHNLEAGGRFDKHLHNGDPLTARTRQVPANRPAGGKPPFTWEVSAVDALLIKGLDKISVWPIERALYEAERYNGFGYRMHHAKDLSPYLWAKTNHNDGTGKYVADGKWDPNAPSEKQCGFAPTLKVLCELDQSIKFGKGPVVAPQGPRPRPQVPSTSTTVGAGLGGAAVGGAAAKQTGASDGLSVWVGVAIGLAIAIVVGVILSRRK